MTTKGKLSKALDEGISTLMDELRLAFQWSRPSILLAVHGSKWGQAKAKEILAQKIKRENKQVIQILVTKENGHITHLIQAQKVDRGSTVFFISGLGENQSIYPSLNMQREFFVEENIRAVFWLTEAESIALPRFAPDFWAFRHRVVEFASSRGSKKNMLASGVLLWGDSNGFEEVLSLNNMARSRETTLATLSNRDAQSLKLESLTSLIHLYWLLGETDNLNSALKQAGQIAKKLQGTPESTWFDNAKAIIEYHNGNMMRSLPILQAGQNTHPLNGILMINLSIVLHALGKNKIALKQAGQAVKQEPANSRLWNVLGCIQLSMGNMEKATAHFEKAILLQKQDETHRFGLAICYYKSGQIEKCHEFIRNHVHSSNPLQDAWKNLLLGDEGKAFAGLKMAIDHGVISRIQVLGDVYLKLLSNKVQAELFDQ